MLRIAVPLPVPGRFFERGLLWLGAITAALLAAPASACLSPEHSRSLVLSVLPKTLPKGAIVADVALTSRDEKRLSAGGIVAHVRRAYQAPKGLRSLILRRTVTTSCDAPFANGTSGIIVAKPVGRQGGMIVAEPLLVARSTGYRLSGGYQFPPGFPKDSR